MLKNTINSKIEQALRIFLVNHLNKYIPFILLTEYPKSGGTWLSQLISEYLSIPFPRNTFPKYSYSLVHGHYSPKKNFENINNIIWLVRDGRDVIISLYHHYLIWNEKNRINPKDVKYHRSKLKFSNYNDIRNNLPRFIEYVFNHSPSKFQQFTYMGNWSDYNQKWNEFNNENCNTIMVKYEDLLKNTYLEMIRILEKSFKIKEIDEKKLGYVVDKYSFENQTNRLKGIENRNSFLRKGISGDWKNYFEDESAELFNQYAGDILIKLGYEKNKEWINHI